MNPVFLQVNNLNDIKKIKGHLQLNLLLKGVKIPQKRKAEEDLQEVNNFISS